jgi:SAM-dependent methyltransferase
MTQIAPTSDALRGSSGRLAQIAYDALAPFYDSFTSDYEYERWLRSLEDWSKKIGLRGHDALDVGCGTGKSFLPLIHRGYRVTACDISVEMVRRARTRAQGAAHVVVADMRSLPWISKFDLITCLDDAVNYLLSAEELEAALSSMWATLRPGGILLFDTNSLGTYRETFGSTFERRDEDLRFRWRGAADAATAPGSVCEATLEVIDGTERSITTRHVQRHWPVSVLRHLASRVGFHIVQFRGQVTGGRLVGEPDEICHTKVVCLAKKPMFSAVTAGLEPHESRGGGDSALIVKT